MAEQPFHGVYVQEQSTQMVQTLAAMADMVTVVDVFPIHLATQPVKANDPVLLTSAKEAAQLVGIHRDMEKYPGGQSTNSAGVHGIWNMFAINLLNRENPAHVKNEENNAFKVKVVSDRVEPATAIADGDTDGIFMDTIVIKSLQDVVYREGIDYALTRTNAGEVLVTPILGGGIFALNATTLEVTLKLSFLRANPAGLDKWECIGGMDVNTGEVTGLEAINRINPKYGHPYVPGQIISPGFCEDPDVAAMLQAKARNINDGFMAMALIDLDDDPKTGAAWYQQAAAQKQAQGVSSTHALALWPSVKTGTRVTSNSAHYAAAKAVQTARNGGIPSQTPSNDDFHVTGACLKDGTEILLEKAQANVLNRQGIVTVRNRRPFVIWGNYTAAYPGVQDPKDYWLNIRYLFNWINNTLIMTFDSRVSSLLNRYEVEEAIEAVKQWLDGLSAAKQIPHGARVEWVPELNPPQELYKGLARVLIHLGAYPPLQALIFLPQLDPQLLVDELDGIGGAA